MADQVTKSITVKGDAARLYNLWADIEHFPQFMKYIKSVKKTGPKTSHWVVAGPLGQEVEWTAETTRLEENRRIGWSTKDNEGLTTSGQVVFAPLADDETQVTVTMHYVTPGGPIGRLVAELFSDPDKRLNEDLRNFKAYAEGMTSRIGS